MKQLKKTFVDAYIAGEAFSNHIDDWVKSWHDEETELTLPEFLGFTVDEYSLWVRYPKSINTILELKKANEK